MRSAASNKHKRRMVPAGAPPWMVTFADLSTLLLSFFVLLLSFSEMDAHKYKEIAGSLRMAFGIQQQDFASNSPLGTSFVARNFGPGQALPPPLASSGQTRAPSSKAVRPIVPATAPTAPPAHSDTGVQAQTTLAKLKSLFQDEIGSGVIEVAQMNAQIVIRIREQGSFPSGSAELIKPFLPAIRKIGQAIRMTKGQVIIAGHTDNIPIHNAQFRSNWDLSAARAVTLLRKLEDVAAVDPNRITVAGHADTRPLVPNDTPLH
ncbi:MAG TPA: flagellar motor protein MotB, partial [Nitrococcus sp.]|nr:flagellar motor protein MotB [Nitrococcus sp.]